MTIEQMAAALNQRIMQFLTNALQTWDGDYQDTDFFYTEDDELKAVCSQYYEQHKK